MADARSTVPRGTPLELLTWLPGDDRVRDLSLDGRELRSYPGEVHHLRLLPDGGFATCVPARPGARERVVRAWHPGGAGPTVLARWVPRAGMRMRFDQPGIRPLDIDPRLRFMAYGWEDGLYRLALGSPRGTDSLVGRAPAARFSTLAFDATGEHLAWSTGGEGLRVWDLGSPQEGRRRE